MGVGRGTAGGVPSPSWRLVFEPQQSTAPLLTAQVWAPPAEIWLAWVRPETTVGVAMVVVVPSPSWPLSLRPQQETLASGWSAQAWPLPTAMAWTPLRPEMGRGRSLTVSPHRPQHQIRPA